MTAIPWWEQWPGRLEAELAALDAAKIPYARDEVRFREGILCLHVTVACSEGTIPLEVVFPDVYPYFRFEVYAPTLDLPFHQNPLERNLCLIGRRTHFWNPNDTVAGLLQSQLANLLSTARSADVAAVTGLEQQQAEPLSEYYVYGPGMILVRGDWTIPATLRHGLLKVGTLPQVLLAQGQFIRGAVLQLCDAHGEAFWSADEQFRRAFSGKALDARWTRLQEPLRHFMPDTFIQKLMEQDAWLKDVRPNHVIDRWLRIWAVLFPEEMGHRAMGEGWIFMCAWDKNRPHVGPSAPKYVTSSKVNRKGRKGGR